MMYFYFAYTTEEKRLIFCITGSGRKGEKRKRKGEEKKGKEGRKKKRIMKRINVNII